MSGRRRMMIFVPASVSSSSPMVLPSSTFISSSTRLIQGVSCSCKSISLLFIPFENKAGILAAKTHRVGRVCVGGGLVRVVRHVVETESGGGMVRLDRRRYAPRQDGHDGESGFNSARRSECMSSHGFGGANRQARGIFSEAGLDSLCLCAIIVGSRGAVRVNVVHLVGTQPCFLQRPAHCSYEARATRGRFCHMVGISS